MVSQRFLGIPSISSKRIDCLLISLAMFSTFTARTCTDATNSLICACFASMISIRLFCLLSSASMRFTNSVWTSNVTNSLIDYLLKIPAVVRIVKRRGGFILFFGFRLCHTLILKLNKVIHDIKIRVNDCTFVFQCSCVIL